MKKKLQTDSQAGKAFDFESNIEGSSPSPSSLSEIMEQLEESFRSRDPNWTPPPAVVVLPPWVWDYPELWPLLSNNADT